jgi:hypothetical protein
MACKMVGAILWGVVACWALSGVAAAQRRIPFDPDSYRQLASAGAIDTIAPGTVITLANWQQYKRFMPFGLQVLYSGKYFWHVGSGPDYTLTVGPARPILLTRQFVRDTEKYGHQTRLVKVGTGGFDVQGYVAGLPFPNPTEPQLGEKILYNARYLHYTQTSELSFSSFIIDRFLNVAGGSGEGVSWRLSHISAPGQSINPPYGRGYLTAIRNTITIPEEVKYLTSLSLEPDNLNVPQEFWEFLPALRRPFRLSSAARCAPIFGSDFVNDDQNDGLFFLPANFKVTFLGEHKILNLLHASTDPAVRFNPASVIIGGSVPGWPKPVLGNWELRDVYVLDITPLPVMGRYCYGHKVIYVDKEGWFASPLEIYDADSRLWKYVFGSATSVEDRNGDGRPDVIPISNHFVFLDFQNIHATMSITGPYKNDNDAPAEVKDPAVAAFPGSLMNIMK